LHPVHFVLHVNFPDVFLGSENYYAQNDDRNNQNVYHEFFNPFRAAENQNCIEYDEPDSNFSWASAEIGDFEIASCTEREKRTYHKCAEYRDQQENYITLNACEQKRIADEDAGHENKIQQMVHEKAPFGNACVAVTAKGAVETIRKPL
jgi:hypothetical protein